MNKYIDMNINEYNLMNTIRQATAMNKIPQLRSSGGRGAPASLVSGALDQPGAPPARSAVAPLPQLLPLLWCFIHCCSLPYVIYYLIFDFICSFIDFSTFILYFSLVVGGGRW